MNFFLNRGINADRGSLEVEPKGGTVDVVDLLLPPIRDAICFCRQSGEAGLLLSFFYRSTSAVVAYFKLLRGELSLYGIGERVYTLHPKHARCTRRQWHRAWT